MLLLFAEKKNIGHNAETLILETSQLVCVDALHASQQFFSPIESFSGLPELNPY